MKTKAYILKVPNASVEKVDFGDQNSQNRLQYQIIGFQCCFTCIIIYKAGLNHLFSKPIHLTLKVTIRLGFPQPEITHYASDTLNESESEKFHQMFEIT